MKKEHQAMIEMLICAALWSMAGIFIKQLPWNGFAVAGLRSFIAGLTILAYILIKRYKLVFNRKTLLAGFFSGSVYVLFVVANKLTTAANAIVLQFTSPVFIVIFTALFLKTKIRRADAMVVFFTLIGIALFFFDQLAPGYILGNVIAIVAGMFMAGMFIVVGELPPEERFSGVFLGQVFCFLVGLPFIIVTKPVMTPVTVSCILILGVFQLGISYVLYAKSSRYCPPLACCLLGALEPLLNPVWVFLFDGERPGVFALIGAVIVIITVTLWCAFGQEKAAPQPQTET